MVANAWEEGHVDCTGANVDLILTLGGDGTLLRAARVAAPCRVPVIGVKIGDGGIFVGAAARGVFGEFAALVQQRLLD